MEGGWLVAVGACVLSVMALVGLMGQGWGWWMVCMRIKAKGVGRMSRVRGEDTRDTDFQLGSSGYGRAGICRSSWEGLCTGCHEKAPVCYRCSWLAMLHGTPLMLRCWLAMLHGTPLMLRCWLAMLHGTPLMLRCWLAMLHGTPLMLRCCSQRMANIAVSVFFDIT